MDAARCCFYVILSLEITLEMETSLCFHIQV